MESSKRRKNSQSISPEPAAGELCAAAAAAAAAVAAAEIAIDSSSTRSFQMRDWSYLTDPLLLAILRRLHTLEDYFAFRGVCRSWRALSAPSPGSVASQHPLLLLTRFPGYTEAFYDIVHGRLYGAQLPWRVSSRRSIAYAHGYLVTATDSPGAKLLLWNIFTEARIRLPKAPERFDRVRLSSHPSSHGCQVLLFARREAVVQYLHVGDPLWTVVHCFKPLQLVSDMIFYKNKLYALDVEMRLLAIDLEGGLKYQVLGAGNESAEAAAVIERHRERWLAVSGDELLAVCYKLGGGFDIFHWDFESNCWKGELTLGGRALFIGCEGFAGSVAASEMGIKGDCIYYLGYHKDEWFEYSLEDQSFMVVSPASPGLLRGRSTLPPVWVLPSFC